MASNHSASTPAPFGVYVGQGFAGNHALIAKNFDDETHVLVSESRRRKGGLGPVPQHARQISCGPIILDYRRERHEVVPSAAEDFRRPPW